jgi:carbamoyl-phosphate synthase large subunit
LTPETEVSGRDTVLVTGIGGNVGQGVLRVLRNLTQPPRIVGTNTVRVSGGNHLCDRVHQTPWAWDDDYVPALARVCADEGVRLIIPTTDPEAARLAAAVDELPPVAVSPLETCEVFVDKLITARRFEASGIPFARSVLPSEFAGQFESTLVKPRLGRGSRDLHVDPPAPASFGDDFVVQELLRGDELTTAFYVTRDGSLHGMITMRRALRDGATVACTVTSQHDDAIGDVVRGMCRAFTIRGSCNVQTIALAGGDVIPFEVNCRISGTNSIRHHFGFRDVVYTIDEYLWDRHPEPVAIVPGSAVRLLMDVIYPGRTCAEVEDAGTQHLVF